MLADALDHAARGWKVVPCIPFTKQPSVPRGVHDASGDPDWIARWYGRHPDDNVAVAAGASGLTVIDLDVKHCDGITAFAELADRHDGWPVTREIDTPSKGRHLYFAGTVPSSSNRLGPGIDVKSVGGYVLAPSSRLANGRYRLELDVPPAPLPCWLAGLCAPPVTVTRLPEPARADRYGAAALAGEVERVLCAPEGERNTTLNLAAFLVGQLVDLLDVELARGALTAAGLAVGLDQREVTRTVASGLTAGARRPRIPIRRRTS